jgi:TolA-binding protein
MEAESTQSTERYLKTLAWLHANQKKLILGAIVVAAVALTLGVIAWQKSAAESEANADLLSMPLMTFHATGLEPAPAGPFLDLAKKRPDTTAGEYAALLGAGALFTEGKYPEAHQAFIGFIDRYPSSPLIPQAKVGLAASLEGEGKIADAAQKYQEIITTYSADANIVAPAKLTLARLDEALNKPEQAFSYYQDLARINNPYDPWAGEARERAQLLLAKHPELNKPAPASASPASAASRLPGLDVFPSTPSNKTPAPAAAKP